MYYYLYDEHVSAKRYQSELYAIEARLADLGIQGKVGRLHMMQSANDMIARAIRAGAKTIVAVGNDTTVTQCIHAVNGTDVILGIIPVGEPQTLSQHLGIPKGVRACEILSARIVQQYDVGMVNRSTFLTTLEIPKGSSVELHCDNAYSVTLDTPRRIRIENFPVQEQGTALANPGDGRLTAVIDGSTGGSLFHRGRASGSILPFRTARIESTDGPVELVADGAQRIATPVIVGIAPERLRIIVGRERTTHTD